MDEETLLLHPWAAPLFLPPSPWVLFTLLERQELIPGGTEYSRPHHSVLPSERDGRCSFWLRSLLRPSVLAVSSGAHSAAFESRLPVLLMRESGEVMLPLMTDPSGIKGSAWSNSGSSPQTHDHCLLQSLCPARPVPTPTQLPSSHDMVCEVWRQAWE